MSDLPTDIDFGYVVMSAVLAVGDTTGDVNRDPDAVPVEGTVAFTPVAKQFLSTATPPTMVLPMKVECSFDANGRMIDPTGAEGVWLVTGFYDVVFSLSIGSLAGFRVEVTTAHTLVAPLDLTIAYAG